MSIPTHTFLQFAETKAQIVDSLLDEEKADTQQQSISKLRARRAALEAENDPRYSGKKVLRKDLKKDDVKYDPELAKFSVLEGSEEEEDSDIEEDGSDEEEEEEEDGYEEEEENESEEEEENESGEENQKIDNIHSQKIDKLGQNTDKTLTQKFKKLGTSESNARSDVDEEEGSSEENEEIKKLYQGLQKKQKGVT